MYKHSIVILLTSLLLLSHPSPAQTHCNINASPILAEYGITKTITTAKTKERSIGSHFKLARQGQQVAHHYDEQATTEVWHQASNKRTSMTRYYLEAQRGIEYQANEINDTASWQNKYQLISNAQLMTMQKTPSKEQNCQQPIRYQLSQSEQNIVLEWLPQQQLVKSLTITHNNGNIEKWQLLKTSADKLEVAAFFNQYQYFNTVDYADIGDNESDPFFAKLINQGFRINQLSDLTTTQSHNNGQHNSHNHDH